MGDRDDRRRATSRAGLAHEGEETQFPWAELLLCTGAAFVLVGLVGLVLTVVEMHRTFYQVVTSSGTGSPSKLAEGVSGALWWTWIAVFMLLPGAALCGIGYWVRGSRSTVSSRRIPLS